MKNFRDIRRKVDDLSPQEREAALEAPPKAAAGGGYAPSAEGGAVPFDYKSKTTFTDEDRARVERITASIRQIVERSSRQKTPLIEEAYAEVAALEAALAYIDHLERVASQLDAAEAEKDEWQAVAEKYGKELRKQWLENHMEHCRAEWPHDGPCFWPPPTVLTWKEME